jgi:hypothetical protein
VIVSCQRDKSTQVLPSLFKLVFGQAGFEDRFIALSHMLPVRWASVCMCVCV